MTRPAQSPVDAPRTLPRDTGPVLLYAGALRHLAGRAARFLAVRLLRTAERMDPRRSPRDAPGAAPVVEAARAASLARHPSAWPHGVPAVTPGIRHPHLSVVTGHGASEGDPDL
jgi:hypothetical protein